MSSLDRSLSCITSVGVFDPAWVQRVRAKVTPWDSYFVGIQPVPFLDDTTTKNVLVHEGHLSGIVDVDEVCFGDPIFTIALTQMALLSSKHDVDYIDMWCDLVELSAEQRRVLNLYTAIFCVDFMGEIGQRFNRTTPLPADPARIQHLENTLTDLLQRI